MKTTMTLFSPADEGQFESFINLNSLNEREMQLRARILHIINELAKSDLFPEMNYASLRGSADKHTDIEKHSDLDIVVDCAKTITRRMQKDFLQELRNELMREGIPAEYARKAIAVTFDCGYISFDLLFSKPGKWCPEAKAKQLEESGTSNPFHNQPVLQRTVRALKLLIREVSHLISPQIFSIYSSLHRDNFLSAVVITWSS
jgi:hypothetical protein